MKVVDFIFASGQMKERDEACLVHIAMANTHEPRPHRNWQHQAIGPITTCSTSGKSIRSSRHGISPHDPMEITKFHWVREAIAESSINVSACAMRVDWHDCGISIPATNINAIR